MSLMHRAVPLHDIADAEGFVRANISKVTGLVLTRDEREELIAEGLVILCTLARKYQPRMAGYTKDGSFAGYASRLLGPKLSDAYHRSRENHLCRTQPDGSRKIEYLPRAKSYEEMTNQGRNNNMTGDRFNATHSHEHTFRRPGNFIAVPTHIAA